jgi:enolase-phosphatase E1
VSDLRRGTIALLDVEGTTTPIAFVKETLFPFARERMAKFVTEHADEPAVAAEIAAVAKELGAARPDAAAAVHTLLAWSDADKKVTPLKSLQGMIWKQGYESGALKGPVFNDAMWALKRWRDRGVATYIYSSGSVTAQKLLFRYSDQGDLLPYIVGHFDTLVGPKLEARSYAAIAAALGKPPSSIVFLSDHVGETRAAAAAGMAAMRVLRSGEVPPVIEAWSGPTVATFDAL